MRHLRTFYWTNVDPRLVARQREVCTALGLDLVQDEGTGTRHGVWMTRVMEGLAEDDSILFLDIDCIPLQRDIVDQAFAAAEAGRLFGAAHSAVHIDADLLYPGPMFLAFSKRLWLDLGSPDLDASLENDAAQRLARVAKDRGVPIDLLFPTFVGVPKWRLGSLGCTGIATTYAGAVFHLFRSRRDEGDGFVFDSMADAAIHGTPIDYVRLHRRLNAPSALARRQIRRGIGGLRAEIDRWKARRTRA